MLETKIHLVYVRTLVGPAAINISGQYWIELDVEKKSIEVFKLEKAAVTSLAPPGIGSFHALYGINGSGKTQALLDICATFSKSSGERPLAVLFSDGEELFFSTGTLFGGWSIAETGVGCRKAKHPPISASVFYTTSPFEAIRRRHFQQPLAIDATPKLGVVNLFDGLALLKHYDNLPPDIVSAAKIRIRTKLPSPEEIVEELIRTIRTEDGKRLQQTGAIKSVFLRWFKSLEPEKQRFLRIEFCITRLDADRDHWADETVRLFAELTADVVSDDRSPARDLTYRQFRHILEYSSKDSRYKAEQIQAFLDGDLNLGLGLKRRSASLDELRQVFPRLTDSVEGLIAFMVQAEILSFSVSDLSSGQTAYLLLFASLTAALRKLEARSDEHVFLLVDEGEMFMHPMWQREYIAKLCQLVSSFSVLASRTHVVISTHSLIVAGDAPPNSLLDMGRARPMNAFGLGPRFILEDIYGVRFAGTNSASYLQRLAEFMEGRNNSVNSEEAAKTASELADESLKAYVFEEISRRSSRNA